MNEIHPLARYLSRLTARKARRDTTWKSRLADVFQNESVQAQVQVLEALAGNASLRNTCRKLVKLSPHVEVLLHLLNWADSPDQGLREWALSTIDVCAPQVRPEMNALFYSRLQQMFLSRLSDEPASRQLLWALVRLNATRTQSLLLRNVLSILGQPHRLGYDVLLFLYGGNRPVLSQGGGSRLLLSNAIRLGLRKCEPLTVSIAISWAEQLPEEYLWPALLDLLQVDGLLTENLPGNLSQAGQLLGRLIPLDKAQKVIAMCRPEASPGSADNQRCFAICLALVGLVKRGNQPALEQLWQMLYMPDPYFASAVEALRELPAGRLDLSGQSQVHFQCILDYTLACLDRLVTFPDTFRETTGTLCKWAVDLFEDESLDDEQAARYARLYIDLFERFRAASFRCPFPYYVQAMTRIRQRTGLTVQ